MHEAFVVSNHTPITLVKIGGSLISDKTRAYSVKKKALAAISKEVKKIQDAGIPLILGHGAGSFAHVPAKEYQTHRGFINERSREGVVKVASAARNFHQIVMESLLSANVLCVSVAPLSCMTGRNHELGHLFVEPIKLLLSLGIIPVVFGDQIVDEHAGCTVFPTEKVLLYVAKQLQADGYTIKQMIHCSQAGGVLDEKGALIRHITPALFPKIKNALGASNGVDISGGMLQKVVETLNLAKQGISGAIIDGISAKLSECAAGKIVQGTYISNV